MVRMDMSLAFAKFALVTLAGIGYATATYFMKQAAETGALASAGLAMLVFQGVVITEVLLLRNMDLSKAYMLVIGVESLMVILVALWLGETMSLCKIAGGGLVLFGLVMIAR